MLPQTHLLHRVVKDGVVAVHVHAVYLLRRQFSLEIIHAIRILYLLLFHVEVGVEEGFWEQGRVHKFDTEL